MKIILVSFITVLLFFTLSLHSANSFSVGHKFTEFINAWKNTSFQRFARKWECRIVVQLASKFSTTASFRDMVESTILKGCIDFKIETENVCKGIMKAFNLEFFSAISYGILDPVRICDEEFYLFKNWTVEIPPKPKNLSIVKPIWPNMIDAPSFNIIQLTDLHLDFNYSVLGHSKCQEPLCCHNDSTPINGNKLDLPGLYGDYNCDTPLTLFSSLLDYIPENIKANVLYLTGDLSPHCVWKQDISTEILYLKTALASIRSKLGDRVRVFPCIGNHDSDPVDGFPSESEFKYHSNQWLYDLFAETNKDYLEPSAIETIKKGGFYTTLIKEGLRLISLNTNFCDTMNFWMIIDDVDPFHQFKWLTSVLLSAEKKGEKVHIIGHHPFGSNDCRPFWSYNANLIFSRFADTITGIFTGHEHGSSFELRFGADNTKLAEQYTFFRILFPSVIHMGPSITPYKNYNPAFHVYSIYDQVSSFVVLNYETHYFNISNYKVKQYPKWSILMNAKAEFNMTDLSPSSFTDLVQRMNSNKGLYDIFQKAYYRREFSPYEGKKYDFLCGLLTSVNNIKKSCEDILGNRKISITLQ